MQRLVESASGVEEQLVFWEQIHTASDDIASWLDSTNEKLEQNVVSFGDSNAIELELQKYKVCSAVCMYVIEYMKAML